MHDDDEKTTTVDLTAYRAKQHIGLAKNVSTSYAYGRYTVQGDMHVMAQLGYGLDPRKVPVSALQAMSTNAAVYLAERTISGIVRRPDLYSIKHDDPKIVAEVEAWLWPLLPALTAAAAHAFAYGTVVVIFDWERKTLRVKVPSKGGKTRKKTLERHTHFADAFEPHPDDTTLDLNAQGKVERVKVADETYRPPRAHVWAWDPEFGPLGQGAKRRAWRPYCEHLLVTVLRDKYLERSVDAPRVAYVPDGKVEVDGTTYTVSDYVNLLLADLRGSGQVSLPSVRDANGNKKYELDVLEIPDRKDTWEQALNRCECEMFIAYLVSPTLSGGMDGVGGAASKTLDGMLREHVEDLANWVAKNLERIVGIVHRANYDPEEVEEPEVVATDVGKAAARKIMQEVLRLANSAARGELALRVDLPAVLDKLGVPLRDEPPEFPEGWGGPSSSEPEGRSKEPGSDREERREDGRTEEGEEDTGAPRDDDGEQTPGGAQE